ncbi:tRNA lysidine(34) synthetase TilS [Mycoplasma procyoni]|uniref:tRNA lysidine(34) synthetase TilS n=1 Tax=Mycoplasma procyoni TaxID=568784 RepID=UPI00197C15C6|nr:tRNA lysidine(34) synthetase TilS [Mycoplasma procyoni]MBN3534800.1 tRNA lysidine(34) synthetase TilS [Mycoplasma procyoni]
MQKTKKQNKKFLLAVSGGPDSMFMLEKFKDRNIIVAHVNYNKREDSWKDQKIVEEFCKIHKIPLFIYSVSESEYTEKGNFQSLARKIRYSFFKEIYDKESCDVLLIAHNKDDFLETALMQKENKRNPFFWGIKQQNVLHSMNIYRPFLFKKWKKQIENNLIKRKIPFAIDYTNTLDIYSRNKIRNIYRNKQTTKCFLFYKFRIKNFFLQIKEKRVLKSFSKWELKNFSIDFLKKNSKVCFYLLFIFLHKFCLNIELSTKKINSIIEFIFANNQAKKYKLSDYYFLDKSNKKLTVISYM